MSKSKTDEPIKTLKIELDRASDSVTAAQDRHREAKESVVTLEQEAKNKYNTLVEAKARNSKKADEKKKEYEETQKALEDARLEIDVSKRALEFAEAYYHRIRDKSDKARLGNLAQQSSDKIENFLDALDQLIAAFREIDEFRKEFNHNSDHERTLSSYLPDFMIGGAGQYRDAIECRKYFNAKLEALENQIKEGWIYQNTQ